MVDGIVLSSSIVQSSRFLERRALISASMWTGGVVESEGGDTVGLLECTSFYPLNVQACDSLILKQRIP